MKYTLSGSLIPFELENIQRFKKRKEKLEGFLNIKIYHIIHSSLIIITSIHIDSMIRIRSTQSPTLIKILEYTHPPFCQSKLYPLSIFTYQKLDSHIHPSTFRLENSKSIRKTRFQIRKERERERKVEIDERKREENSTNLESATVVSAAPYPGTVGKCTHARTQRRSTTRRHVVCGRPRAPRRSSPVGIGNELKNEERSGRVAIHKKRRGVVGQPEESDNKFPTWQYHVIIPGSLNLVGRRSDEGIL